MNHHTYFPANSRIVETCLVGTGGFGRSFLAQARHVPLLNARIAVDLDAQIVANALRSAGIAQESIAVCTSAEQARAAWDAGHFIAVADLAYVLDLPFEVLVEATGHPEAAARHARLAIDAGKHVAMVSKEADSVVGPGLAQRAAAKGLVVTPVDGDQPSLLIGLATWAEVLGLEIVSAGKSSEYDFMFDPATGQITSNGVTVDAPEFGQHVDLSDGDAQALVGARSAAASMLKQRAVPDLCELAIAANAVGLAPDVPGLHCPILRIPEVPSVLCTVEDGGILSGTRRIDVFHCLRLPGEVSFAGGVFVVVKCRDDEAWAMLAEKGHVVSRNGRTAMLYLPRHILGLEAATSILEAALKGVSSGAAQPKPHLDLVAVAEADIPAGTLLEAKGHHHSIDDVTAALVPAAPLAPETPAPFYLVANRTLARDVSAGATITLADLVLDDASELLTLRRAQDRHFAG